MHLRMCIFFCTFVAKYIFDMKRTVFFLLLACLSVSLQAVSPSGTLPVLYIQTENSAAITSKEDYINATYYLDNMGLSDYQSIGTKTEPLAMEIKGRGNYSWTGFDKKPYRIKFDQKQSLFGLHEAKSWVLLANAQSGSLMANAIAMKIGQMAGAEYTNHIVPVELYMNGQYMGSYMFTEKVGLANNSVDVDEDTGYLLELDSNSDDEYKFNSKNYNLPVFVKEPDLNDSSTPNVTARKRTIPDQFNELCNALYQGKEIDDMADMGTLANFILANDLALNQELGHPKSIFMFKEVENSSSSKYKFGPIWDFDWGFGYENGHSYCYYGTTSSLLNSSMYSESGYKFFSDLMNLESFKKHYYKAWVEFMNDNSIDELFDYIDHYYSFAESSFENNLYAPNNAYGFTETDKNRHKEWIEERANFIYENLEKYDIDDLIHTMAGDVNNNNQITIHDVALVTAHINGNTHTSLSTSKADYDKNGNIELSDAGAIVKLIESNEAPIATYWYSTPLAISEFIADEMVLEVGDTQLASLNLLSYGEEEYKAMQFDVTLPQGISVIDVFSGDITANHNLSYTDRGNNIYRITAYSDNDECFSEGELIAELILSCEEIINEENRNIKISNAYVVDNETNELRINDYNISFTQSTGVNNVESDNILVEGGDCIMMTLLEPQLIEIYSVDGRKVREINAKKGTTRIAIPAGIYIVNGEKVVVR